MNYQEILDARKIAHAKHGENSIESLPAGSWDDHLMWLPILAEEFGEVAATLTYDKSVSELRSELIDLISVATAWVDAIDGNRK